MIHLDTHVMVWLYTEQLQKLTTGGRRLLEREQVGFSPMVRTELALLHEIDRVAEPPDVVLARVRTALDLVESTTTFARVAQEFVAISWTRDPLDRLIVANARADGVRLLTRDRLLRQHAHEAIWP